VELAISFPHHVGTRLLFRLLAGIIECADDLEQRIGGGFANAIVIL
jgi:hypothetical protein